MPFLKYYYLQFTHALFTYFFLVFVFDGDFEGDEVLLSDRIDEMSLLEVCGDSVIGDEEDEEEDGVLLLVNGDEESNRGGGDSVNINSPSQVDEGNIFLILLKILDAFNPQQTKACSFWWLSKLGGEVIVRGDQEEMMLLKIGWLPRLGT